MPGARKSYGGARKSTGGKQRRKYTGGARKGTSTPTEPVAAGTKRDGKDWSRLPPPSAQGFLGGTSWKLSLQASEGTVSCGYASIEREADSDNEENDRKEGGVRPISEAELPLRVVRLPEVFSDSISPATRIKLQAVVRRAQQLQPRVTITHMHVLFVLWIQRRCNVVVAHPRLECAPRLFCVRVRLTTI